MTFTRAAIWGFGAGFVAAVAISRIKVRTPAFLISADGQEHLSKKEAAVRINDVLEDRDILFDLMSVKPKIDPATWDLMQIKALTEPRWKAIVKRILVIAEEDK